MQFKADLAAQDVIFDSFILSDFLTFGKTSSETRQFLYLLDGLILMPAVIFYNKFTYNSDPELYKFVFEGIQTSVAVALGVASLGFLIRPLVVSELHMTYYRSQLGEAGKYNFMAMTIWLPVFTAIMILGLATSMDTSAQVPLTTCL